MKNTTRLNPYLTFKGNCREAMEHYKEVFDGELEIMPFEGSPVEVPDSYKEEIMHSTLRVGDAIIMASDGQPSQPIEIGNAHFMMVNTTELGAAKRYFEKLSGGGQVIMPMEKTFWGSVFGMLTDKFGIGWMISVELSPSN